MDQQTEIFEKSIFIDYLINMISDVNFIKKHWSFVQIQICHYYNQHWLYLKNCLIIVFYF